MSTLLSTCSSCIAGKGIFMSIRYILDSLCQLSSTTGFLPQNRVAPQLVPPLPPWSQRNQGTQVFLVPRLLCGSTKQRLAASVQFGLKYKS